MLVRNLTGDFKLRFHSNQVCYASSCLDQVLEAITRWWRPGAPSQTGPPPACSAPSRCCWSRSADPGLSPSAPLAACLCPSAAPGGSRSGRHTEVCRTSSGEKPREPFHPRGRPHLLLQDVDLALLHLQHVL